MRVHCLRIGKRARCFNVHGIADFWPIDGDDENDTLFLNQNFFHLTPWWVNIVPQQ